MCVNPTIFLLILCVVCGKLEYVSVLSKHLLSNSYTLNFLFHK